MICPKAANMQSCEPKCLCRRGPCKDKAYSCEKPCAEGCEFLGCDLGCSCQEERRWRIDYMGHSGGTNTCITCEPPRDDDAFFDYVIQDFPQPVSPIGSVTYNRIYPGCTDPDIGCGTEIETVDEFFGGPTIVVNLGWSGDFLMPCGVADMLFQVFISEDGEQQYAVVVTQSWGGAVGCIYSKNAVISVSPEIP